MVPFIESRRVKAIETESRLVVTSSLGVCGVEWGVTA